jgi:peptidoglycan/LPS O-acetylase OafA/YrhL/lysophospholipase L1-like esterase
VTDTRETTRTSSSYWPALDGWRGLTIWIAISVHAGYFTAGGVLSLDTFFVLSGFLITGILVREWLRGDERGAGRIDLPAFWARRARRLLPALFVLLAAVLAYSAFVAPSLGLDKVRGDVLGSLFYVANWRFVLSGQSYFGAFTSPSPVLHLWSLAVEEQFYLFWPPIVLGVLWLARRRLRAEGAVALLGVVAFVGALGSAVLMASLYVRGGDPSRVYYGTDTRAQAMLMGAALAVVVTLHGPLRSRIGRGILSVAAAFGFAVVVLPWFASNATRVHDVFYGQYGLLVYSFATSVVIWRLAQPSPGVLGRGLQLSPVRWIGAISYEMYLWHWPTYLVITPAYTGLTGPALLVVRLTSVVGLAALTHFYIGEPIRRGARLRSPRLSGVFTAAAVIAISVGVFAATVSARPALSGDIGQVADRRGPPTAPTTGVRAAPVPAASVKVLVVGDSQGATLAQGLDADPGLHGLSAQPGLVVWNRAILGCSISTASSFVIDGDRQQNKCGGAGAWQRQWASDVAAFRPDVVVVQAGAWDLYDVAGPGDSVLHPGDPAWNASYTNDVETLFDTLRATGAALVAIRPPCYGTTEVVGSGATPAERLDATRIAGIGSAWQTAARSRDTHLLNLGDTLCPGGRSDASLRPDGAHYDDTGADRVAAIVARTVRNVAAARALQTASG